VFPTDNDNYRAAVIQRYPGERFRACQLITLGERVAMLRVRNRPAAQHQRKIGDITAKM
jgi:hypothetical protein